MLSKAQQYFQANTNALNIRKDQAAWNRDAGLFELAKEVHELRDDVRRLLDLVDRLARAR